MELIASIQDTFLLSLAVQGAACFFLVFLFAALYWHHPRSYFLHWTFAWASFGLYLMAGAGALWLARQAPEASVWPLLLAGLSNVGNWLRAPLLVLGALGFIKGRRARRFEYLLLLAFAAWAVIGGHFIGDIPAPSARLIAHIASPHLLTGAALAGCGYAIFRYWQRAHLGNTAVLSSAFLLFGLDQFQFTTVVLLSSKAQQIPPYSIYLSLAGTMLELIIGMGMVLTMLQDDRQQAQELERTRLETVQRQAGLAAELKRIQRSAAQLTSAKPLDAVLEEIVSVTAEACGTSMNSILLVDEATRELASGASIGLPEEYVKAITRVPMGGPRGGCCGTAAASGEVVIIEDMRTHPLWQPYIELSERSGLRAVWSVPVIGRDGKVLATFATYYREPLRPTLEQIEIVQAYAHHVAVAIENARLYQRLVTSEAKYRGIFEDAVVGIYQTTPDGKLLEANPTLAHMLGFESVEVLMKTPVPVLYVHPEDRVRLRAELEASGIYRGETQLRTGDGRTLWVRDFARVVWDSSGKVSHYEGTLSDITEQKRADAERQVMFEIIQGVNFTSNLDELLHLAHRSLKRVIYAENCFVELYDRSTGLFHKSFFVDQRDKIPPPRQMGRSCSAYVFRTGRPQLINPRVFGQLVEQGEVEPAGQVSPSWLGVPLKTPSETIGVLVVQNYEDQHAYSQRDVKFLNSVGGQIALAIERKRSEEALRHSQQQYAGLMDSISDVVYSIDLEGRFTYVNPAVRQIGGFEPEEMIGKPFVDFVHSEDQEIVGQLFQGRLKGDHQLGEFRTVSKNGEVRYLQSSGRASMEEGEVVGVTGILRDVTEQRRAKARLARIYDVATLHQGQELFDRAAQTLAELLGTRHVVIGELEKDRASVRALAFYDQGSLDTSVSLRYELRSTPCERVVRERRLCVYPQFARELFPDDAALRTRRVESYIGAPIMGSDGTIVGLINAFDQKPRDFSETEIRILQIIGQRVGAEIERMRGEEARENLEQQLIQAQKMEAIGTLAGGVAHDFNNMLAGITGYTSLLMMQMEEDHPFHHAIETIEQSAGRAAELTNQLLGFARGGKYKVAVIDLNQVVERVNSLIARTFDRAIRIETYQSEDLRSVEADAGQIEQCLLNLAVNARDAMPHGGLLLIETQNVQLDESYTRAHLGMRPGRFVMLSVTDTGIGMDEGTRARIFEPFFTTKEQGKGTGMGLAMVYGIVNNHGGHIEVHSETDRGTCFKVYFPVSEKEQCTETPSVQVPIPRGDEMILVVDDEKVIRDLSQEMLEGFGYRVITAADGPEAIRLYRQCRDEIGLVILDMVMPGMSGDRTFERLSEIDPTIRVLLSSGYSANHQIQGVLSAGARGFIHKPYHARQLAEGVRGALDLHPLIPEQEDLRLILPAD